jgi:hypothetical protein
MPEFHYEPRSTNDKSALSAGWHPAFLLAITDDPKPASWRNADTHPRIWRWHFAVWEVATLIGRQSPEHQTAASEQKFSPGGGSAPGGGKFSPSKAWEWTKELLGRDIHPGERINLDVVARQNPIPCRIKIERAGDYANIKDLEHARQAWPDAEQALTPEVRATLAQMLETLQGEPAAAAPSSPAPAPQPPPPGMQSWGTQTAQAPTSPVPPRW